MHFQTPKIPESRHLKPLYTLALSRLGSMGAKSLSSFRTGKAIVTYVTLLYRIFPNSLFRAIASKNSMLCLGGCLFLREDVGESYE